MNFNIFPDKAHPAWRLLQAIVTVIGLIVVVWHLDHAPHRDGVDSTEVLGSALALKLAGELFHLKNG